MRGAQGARTGFAGAARRALVAGAFALSPTLLGAAPAWAEELTLRAQNGAGVPQTAAQIVNLSRPGSAPVPTNQAGRAALEVQPGDELRVSGAAHSVCPVRPAGRQATYTVPSPVPQGDVVITLAQLEETKGIRWGQVRRYDHRELWVAGVVSSFRRHRGLRPLEISNTLSGAAWAWALAERGPLCPSLEDVLGDLGWPDPAAASGYHEEYGFVDEDLIHPNWAFWSGLHAARRAALRDPANRSLGVVALSMDWAVVLGPKCKPTPPLDLCALTGRYGKRIKVDPLRVPKLKLVRLREAKQRSHGQVKLIFRSRPETPAAVKLRLKRPGPPERGLVISSWKRSLGRLVTFFEVRKAGWYRVRTELPGLSDRFPRWRAAEACYRVRVLRRGAVRAGAKQLKVRPCRARG